MAQHVINEKKIINNQLLDSRRQETVEGIFNQIVGTKFDPFYVETIGLGYYEIGDTLTVESGGNTYRCPIFNFSIDFTSGVKERLYTESPAKSDTNYKRVGDHLRKIYNTEIEVNKQKQTITSLVSEQKIHGEKIEENFSKTLQMVDSITHTIQKTGGANLIKNSVGYGLSPNGKVLNWDYIDNPKVSATTSPHSLRAGAISGNQISLEGGTIKQRVVLAVGEKYTFSCRIKKGMAGIATIKLNNNSDNLELKLEDQKTYEWEEKVIIFTPTQDYIDILLLAEKNVSILITDIMLSQGDMRQPWQQSSGEVYNTKVSLDSKGVRVASNVYDGDYVEITPLEFAGYSNASGSQRKVFTLNRDITEVEKLEARQQIDMPPIKIIPVSSGSATGWAFMPSKGIH